MKRRNSVRRSYDPRQHRFDTAESRVSKENRQNIDSVQEMITLLKEYEQMCIAKQDFVLAEQAKNKIELLKGQTMILRQQQLQSQQKQNIGLICKRGQEEIKEFQQFWDGEIQSFLGGLKQIEGNLISQQQGKLQEFKNKLNETPVPKIKLSARALELRSHLSNLIKARKYKQAEQVKNKLKEVQTQEAEKWMEKFNQKKNIQTEQMEKKQLNELQALRTRLEGAFNQKVKERDRKFEILLKKNRKRRVDSSKVSKEKLQLKKGILTESVCYLNKS